MLAYSINPFIILRNFFHLCQYMILDPYLGYDIL